MPVAVDCIPTLYPLPLDIDTITFSEAKGSAIRSGRGSTNSCAVLELGIKVIVPVLVEGLKVTLLPVTI